jgi:4-diphosphocytidyl-2C-methyl-D-erythritol kinase
MQDVFKTMPESLQNLTTKSKLKHNGMDHCLSNRFVLVATRSERQKKIKKEWLTKRERKLCKVLQTVSGSGPWHYAIKNTIGNRHCLDRNITRDFRELIKGLWEQLQDDRGTMIKILDQPAVEALEDFFA